VNLDQRTIFQIAQLLALYISAGQYIGNQPNPAWILVQVMGFYLNGWWTSNTPLLPVSSLWFASTGPTYPAAGFGPFDFPFGPGPVIGGWTGPPGEGPSLPDLSAFFPPPE